MLVNVLKLDDGQYYESSLPEYKLDTTSLPLTPSNIGSSRNRSPLFIAEQTHKTRHQPYSHHAATESVEEFTPFGAAASSNGPLATPSRLSEHFPHYLVTWYERHEHCRQRTQHERNHTGTDCVVLRRRPSRLGASDQTN